MIHPRETPAGHARLLHQQVKELRAEMESLGYSREVTYMVLLNAVLRMAFEDCGDAGIAAVRDVLKSLDQ